MKHPHNWAHPVFSNRSRNTCILFRCRIFRNQGFWDSAIRTLQSSSLWQYFMQKIYPNSNCKRFAQQIPPQISTLMDINSKNLLYFWIRRRSLGLLLPPLMHPPISCQDGNLWFTIDRYLQADYPTWSQTTVPSRWILLVRVCLYFGFLSYHKVTIAVADCSGISQTFCWVCRTMIHAGVFCDFRWWSSWALKKRSRHSLCPLSSFPTSKVKTTQRV